jgi:hypothetical protein
MYKSSIAEPKPRSRPTRAECCTESECGSGVRNQYFVGKRLTPDAFRVEQRYLIERRHLINRAVIGWGVVCGYPIKPAMPGKHEAQGPTGRLSIGSGLALDEAGRELVQTDCIDLQVADMILLDAHGRRAAPGKEPEGCWLLRVHYAERDLGPTAITDPCNCEHQEWDQICETVRYSLSPIECEHCCEPPKCDLHCDCGTGPCCRDQHPEAHREQEYHQNDEHHAEHENREGHDDRARDCNPVRRGGCQCLCDYLSELDCDVDCEKLCVIEEPCARIRVDLCHGVPLACVKLEVDECGCWFFSEEIEACGPRRLVKRNDVLFDLIRGCDLTRISKIGWAPWHRARHPVPWVDFAKSFGDSGSKGRYVTADYWVEFSRPVRADSVRADCFSMTILVPQDEGGWLTQLRVPILGVETNEGAPDLPAGHVTRATLVVDSDWVDDAVRARRTVFADDPTSVEIEVLGDYMVDCNGQTVDANAIGRARAPTGNGVPGDRFISKFDVEARPPQPMQPQPEAQQHNRGV